MINLNYNPAARVLILWTLSRVPTPSGEATNKVLKLQRIFEPLEEDSEGTVQITKAQGLYLLEKINAIQTGDIEKTEGKLLLQEQLEKLQPKKKPEPRAKAQRKKKK